MSTGQRLSHYEATQLAKQIISCIGPMCQRIEIAGSIRRLKLEVGDIELVCIPKPETDLTGQTFYQTDLIDGLLKIAFGRASYVMGDKHYRKYNVGPCMLDLFITTPEQWGLIFTLRTGPASFSKSLVTPRNKGGLLPSFMRVRDGRIWFMASKQAADTPEEKDVFNVLGLKYIYPENRE